ncbi:hypothetical protein H0X06_01690 [Candidatus Dependentiae bacterium]|nr:hypothetical protein [Candidatus Dependentiae bacterium]
MHIVQQKTSREELKKLSQKMFGNLIKAVVNVKRGTMVIDVVMHSDAEAFLLEHGSQQKDLWGI